MALKRFFLYLFTILLISASGIMADDHGNTWDNATSINLATYVNGEIDPANDTDFFKVTLSENNYYIIQGILEGYTLSDSRIWLYDTDGTTQLAYNDNFQGSSAPRIDFVPDSSGTYYFKTSSYAYSLIGTYAVYVANIPDYHSDNWQDATAIERNLSYTGTINNVSDVDFFRVELRSGRDYEISTTLDTIANTQLWLYDIDGTTQLAYNDDDPSGGNASKITYSCTTTGYYYLKVSNLSNETGGYFIEAIENALPFVDVSTSVGITALYDPDFQDGSASWGDYDNDGWIDIYMGSYASGKGVYLFKNNNGSSFTQPFTGTSGNFAMWWAGLFIDYDNDGDQDLYTAIASGQLARNNSGSSYTSVTGLLETFTWQSECSAWADFDNDGWLDFYRSGWESGPTGPYYPDAIFMSNSGASFNISWWQSTESEREPGRGVTICDFDEDNDQDIYVSNYRLRPNFLWINDGTGSFTEQASTYGVEGDDEGVGVYSWGHTIGSAWGDLDNDGHFDLVAGNFSHNWTAGGIYYQDGVTFYRNTGPVGSWYFSKEIEFDYPGSTFWEESYSSVALADFDNDGDLDWFISTSYSGDYVGLFRNDGDWNFTEVSDEYGLGFAATRTNYQTAWADYDNDGDMDIFTDRRLFNNPLDNGFHWLMIKLVGDGENVNRDAIGTQIRINTNIFGQTTTLTRQRESATGWTNQNDPRIHFGLGDNPGPVDLEITWPDGTTQIVADVSADQLVTIEYPPASKVLEWKMDQASGSTVTDTAGSNNGAAAGAPLWTKGVIDNCLQFDGIDDEVLNLAATGLPTNANDHWSINMYLYMDTDPNRWTPLGGFGIPSGDVWDTDGERQLVRNLDIWFFGGSANTNLGSNEQFDIGNWQMITITYDGSKMKIYKNGIEKAYRDNPPFINAANQVALAWKGRASFGEQRFNGKIDEFTIWNDALNQDQLDYLIRELDAEYNNNMLEFDYELVGENEISVSEKDYIYKLKVKNVGIKDINDVTFECSSAGGLTLINKKAFFSSIPSSLQMASDDVFIVRSDSLPDLSNLEWQIAERLEGDINSDGQVDLTDVSGLFDCWLDLNSDPEIDLYNDGIIDLKDFSIIAERI